MTVTAAQPNVVLGTTVQMSASTLDAAGAVLTGRSVAWSTSSAAIATVNSSSGLVTGVSPGTATITGTSEGQSGSASIIVLTNVASVEVTPDPVQVISTLSVQMTATALAADASALTGKTITWETADASIATVDGDGRVTGGTPGSTTVSATSEGITGEAALTVLTPPPVLISSIDPNPLVEGQAAVITGVDFSAIAGDNMVTVDGVTAVVTQATSSVLDIVVPAFDCRPKRSVGVQITVAGESSNVANTTASPASFLQMAVGDHVVLEDPSGFCMQFDEAAGAERYIFGVQSVSEVAATLTPVRVSTTIPAAAPVSPQLAPPSLAGRLVGPSLSPTDLRHLDRWSRHVAAEGAFMDRSRSLLNPLLRSGASRLLASAGRGPALIPGDVTEGTALSVRFPGFDTNSCTDFIDLPVIVRKVGTRAIIVEDAANPAGGFVAQDFTDMATDFDGTIYDVDVDFFGAPSDMDANDRIVIVVTKEVNKLASSPLAFVAHANLFPVATCPASNEGEYYWTRAPDPTGMFNAGEYTLADARLDNRVLLAHEFTHIIQGSRRMAAGGQFMTSFMAEGGATFAQQFVGFQYEGRMDGQNYDNTAIYSTLGADPHDYYAFLWDLLAYFGFDFGTGTVAGAPEQCTFVGSEDDNTAGPCSSAGRLPYGPTYSLVQHALDNYGASLGGTKAVHRALVDHAGNAGFAALEAVFGRTVSSIMGSWAPTLYIDDRFTGAALDMFQFKNFNLRSLEDAWATPAVRIRDQSGNLLPGFFQVWIVRVE